MIQINKSNIAVIFVSRRTDDMTGYAEAAAEMEAEVRQASGYLGHDSVSDADGNAITISYWENEAAAAGWRNHARHREVREDGRKRWYAWYRLVIADVTRAYDWQK